MKVGKGEIVLVLVLHAGKFDHKRTLVSLRTGVHDERLAKVSRAVAKFRSRVNTTVVRGMCVC